MINCELENFLILRCLLNNIKFANIHTIYSFLSYFLLMNVLGQILLDHSYQMTPFQLRLQLTDLVVIVKLNSNPSNLSFSRTIFISFLASGHIAVITTVKAVDQPEIVAHLWN